MEVYHLRNSWGNEVEWYDVELARMEQYRVLTEIDVAGQTYAVLIPLDPVDPHPYLFKYSLVEGAPLLTLIESENEWNEAVDTFSMWLDTNQA